MNPGRMKAWVKGLIGAGEQTAPPLPTTCGIKITDRCNLRCRHCNLYRRRSDEMTTDQVLRLLDGLVRHRFKDVVFSGGELFLRKDMMELLHAATDRKLGVAICTNCSLLDRNRVDELVSLGIRFWLSLDGSTPEIHDRIRGKAGNWEQTVEVMRRLEDLGRPICVKNVIMRENMEDQIAMLNFLKGFAGAELRHDPANVMRLETSRPADGVKAGGDGALIWSDYGDPALADRACNVIDALAELQRSGQSIIKTPPGYFDGMKRYVRGEVGLFYRCNLARLGSLPVNSNGDVSLCGTWISGDYIVGNVVAQEYRLDALWNGKRAHLARLRSVQCPTPCWIDDRFECKERLTAHA